MSRADPLVISDIKSVRSERIAVTLEALVTAVASGTEVGTAAAGVTHMAFVSTGV